MDGKVTALVWNWRLNLQSVDLASIAKFISVHSDWQEAPELGVAR